jgi:transposase
MVANATVAAERAVASTQKAKTAAAVKAEKAKKKMEEANRISISAEKIASARTEKTSKSPETAEMDKAIKAASAIVAAKAVDKKRNEAMVALAKAMRTGAAAKRAATEAMVAKAAAEKARVEADKTSASDGRAISRAAKVATESAKRAITAAAEVVNDPEINLHDLQLKYPIACGLDVHKEKLVACVLGVDNAEDGCEIKEFGTLGNDLTKLAEWINKHKAGIVIMESTGIYWQQPFRKLQEAGINVVLCDAREIKNVKGRKTDITDARWMANIARFDLVRHCRVLPPDMETLRDVSRCRQWHVETMSEYKNKLHKLLVKNGFNISQIVTDITGATGIVIIEGLLNDETPELILKRVECTIGYRLKAPREKLLHALSGRMTETLRHTIEITMDTIESQCQAAKIYESKLYSLLKSKGYEHTLKLMETIPGMSRVSAMTVLAEVGGDLTDFRSAEALSSWAGMCPGNNESAGKRMSGKTRHGNKRLKRILCETAWAATKTQCYFKDKWNSMQCRLGFKKTIVAIGNKMLKIIYYMLTRNEPYKDPNVDITEMMVKRNAPRWIRNLKEYGFI